MGTEYFTEIKLIFYDPFQGIGDSPLLQHEGLVGESKMSASVLFRDWFQVQGYEYSGQIGIR